MTSEAEDGEDAGGSRGGGAAAGGEEAEVNELKEADEEDVS